MKRVYVLYCLSGFVTLGYQVVWFRLFDDQFGATNLTFAMVICGFIGGLGAGALLSGRVTRMLARLLHVTDSLRLYGIIELIISMTALLTLAATLIPADAWGAFPYVLDGNMYESTPGRQLARVGIAAACVFVPCFLMGTTFPLLCRVFEAPGKNTETDTQRDGQKDARRHFPAALYAWNALGACASVLVCQFVLLRMIGHDDVFRMMVVINALIGLYFAAFGREAANSIPLSDAMAPTGTRSPSLRSTDGTRTGNLIALAIVGGLLTGSLEGDAIKRIWFLGGTSGAAMAFVSFWSVLAIFLGALVVRVWKRLSLFHIKIAFVIAAACYSATWHFAYPIRHWLSAGDIEAVLETMQSQTRSRTVSVRFQSSLSQVFIFVGIFVFPAMFLFSLLLPWVCNQLHVARKHLGVAYGLNTLAFCLGVIGFTLIAPRVNIFYSLRLFIAMLAIGVLLVAITPPRNGMAHRTRWLHLAGVAVFGFACAFMPRTFDPDFVMPDSPPTKFPVKELKSNGTHTTYVVTEPAGPTLYFDNHPMSSTARPAQTYMRLMAHFPLLAHPNPRKALLIGFGVGNTASAIATHESIEQIDIVELNAAVIETAPFFAATHYNVHRDHRVRFIHDDGRTFLKLTDQRYDLITSEPPPPMQAGVHRLYSRQYYEQAKAKLTEQGLMTQWLPAYQMPREAVDRVVTTFRVVFPHTLMFTGYGREFILVGSDSPIELKTIEQRFSQSRSALLDLQRFGITEPVSLFARIVATDATLRSEFARGEVINDQHNDLAWLFANPAEPTVIPYGPGDVLPNLGISELQCGERLIGILSHMGRLCYYVPDFPRDTLGTIPRKTGIRMADADWATLDGLRRDAAIARYQGRSVDAIALSQRSLSIDAEQPQILLDLARLYFENQAFENAIEPLKKFQAIEPADTTGYRAMVETLVELKRFDAALEHAARCVQLQPNRADFHIVHANILAELGRLPEAIAAYDRALELDAFSLEAKTRRDSLINQLKLKNETAPPVPLN